MSQIEDIAVDAEDRMEKALAVLKNNLAGSAPVVRLPDWLIPFA